MKKTRLTNTQIEALQYFGEQKSIPDSDKTIHGKTLNSLFHYGLIGWTRYANGTFWTITERGENVIKNKLSP